MKTWKIAFVFLLSSAAVLRADDVPPPSIETAATLMQKALQAYQAQRPLEVVQLLGKAHTLAQQQNDKPGEALTLFFYGGLYQKMGLTEQAQSSEEKARALLKEINDPAVTAMVLSSIGVGYKIIAQPERATQFLEEAIGISHKSGNKAIEGFALVNLGWLAKDIGQLQKAWIYLPQGAALLQEAGDTSAQAWALMGQAWLYVDIGQRDKARTIMQQALELVRRPRPARPATTMLDAVRDAVFDVNLQEGKLLMALGTLADDNNEQISYLEQALPLLRAAKSRFYEAQALNELGSRYFWNRQYDKARPLLEEALLSSRESGNKNDEAKVLNNLAKVAVNEGNLGKAIELQQQSLEMLAALGNRKAQFWQLSDLAQWQTQNNNMEAANQAHRASLKILEETRESLGGLSDSKAGFLSSNLFVYHRYIRFLLQRGEVNEAFAWVEKTKARTLLDLMQSGKVDIDFGASDAEKQRRRALQQEAAALNNQLIAEALQPFPSETKIAALKEKLASAESDLQSFTRALYVAHPELAAKRAANTTTVEETVALLPPDTALLNYVMLEDSGKQIYLLVVTKQNDKEQVQAFKIDRPFDEISELLEDYRDACSNPDGKYKLKARELYNLLLAPAQELIQDKKRLIICPDGPLWGAPFAALIRDDKFLAEQYEVDYSYSATALQAALKAKNKAENQAPVRTLLVFANPDFGGAERFQTVNEGAETERPLVAESRALSADSRALIADSRALSADSRDAITRGGAILPLPGTQKEADAIKKDFPDAQIHTAGDAQEATAKALAGNYRYLHFATHGLFNDAAPMLSSVVLAQPPQNSADDGFLTAREIFDLNLKADLVVLSACNTGQGQKKSGEGVIGLTWALFVAGAPAQVVSQWAVNDSSTAVLMQEFYANLKAGQERGAALHNAELSLMKSKPHPYYWAPFVLLGDWRH